MDREVFKFIAVDEIIGVRKTYFEDALLQKLFFKDVILFRFSSKKEQFSSYELLALRIRRSVFKLRVHWAFLFLRSSIVFINSEKSVVSGKNNTFPCNYAFPTQHSCRSVTRLTVCLAFLLVC